MKKVIDKIKFLIEDINVNNLDEYAAGCAYYTILAFIPLMLLIITLTKYIGIDEEFFIFVLEGIIPTDILNDAVISIVKEIHSKSVGTVTISIVITLWSAGKGFFALCKGLNNVYEIDTENEYIKFKLKSLISTIIFILVVVVTLLVLVFGNNINLFLKEKFNIFNKFIGILLKLKVVIGIFLLTIIFSIMYKFIPKHSYKLKNQIPGAFFSAISCNVVSIFYSIYIDVFTGFSIMYGSLTTIVLAMLWIYACMYSILLGGCINKYIIKRYIYK